MCDARANNSGGQSERPVSYPFNFLLYQEGGDPDTVVTVPAGRAFAFRLWFECGGPTAPDPNQYILHVYKNGVEIYTRAFSNNDPDPIFGQTWSGPFDDALFTGVGPAVFRFSVTSAYIEYTLANYYFGP